MNDLSHKLYAETISNKSWKSLEPVLIKYLNQAPHTRTLVVDGEAALSQANIKVLRKKINRPWLKILRAPKHAFLAERFIRTIKFKLAEYCQKDKIHISKGWRKHLPKVVSFCNSKLLLRNGLKPSDVSIDNFLSVEHAINNKIMASLSKPAAKEFKYKLGEILIIKARALQFPDKLGLKRTIEGYNSNVKDMVEDREIRVTGRSSNFLTPYYKLSNHGWFRQADLSR